MKAPVPPSHSGPRVQVKRVPVYSQAGPAGPRSIVLPGTDRCELLTWYCLVIIGMTKETLMMPEPSAEKSARDTGI